MKTEITLPAIYPALTPRQRKEVREKYIELQEGLCAYCKKPLREPPSEEVLALEIIPELFPAGFFTHPVHLHHDHASGFTIGAVHAQCNAVLWQYCGQ